MKVAKSGIREKCCPFNELIRIIRIHHNGIVAYFDRKYSLKGRDFVLDTIFKYFTITSGIILLGIAIITFTINIQDTRENRKRIIELEKKIQLIETKKN